MTGTVFDLKEFSIHDGPGARVTVFLKGCPLRCRWCHNPEGLSSQPQLLWKSNLCQRCGLCRHPCDHEGCKGFDRCVLRCPKGALTVSGKLWQADALAEKLRSYGPMLESLNGGVTLSGGEPLFQADFVCQVLDQLGMMHKAIETSGYASGEVFSKVIQRVDYVMMDLKLADPAQHRQYTGVDNEPILENLKTLKASGKPFLIRVPLIPGITDTRENLRAISRLVGDAPVELLQYNPFAAAKYDMAAMAYPLEVLPQPNPVDLRWFSNAKCSHL